MSSSLKIKLTPQERHDLRLIVRRQKAQQREVVRAQIILHLSKGVSFSETSRTVGVARRIVYKWAKRFVDGRIEGLKDKPRSGRPALFSPDRGNVPDQAGLRTAR
jgi:hypothetical protein